MSDGEENVTPYINDVLPSILREAVIVHTLAIGKNADPKLRNISKATGGKSYFYSTLSEDQTGIIDAVSEPFLDNPENKIIKVDKYA